MKAHEARKLTNARNPEVILDTILKMIKVAAEQGKSSIKVREFGFGDGSLYSGDPTMTQSTVIKELKKLGYTADIKVEEKQFVDIYLDISW